MDYFIVGLISLLSGGIGFVVVDRIRYAASRRKLKNALAFEIAAQSILDQSVTLPFIDRALILKAHNGGKMDHAYSFRFISILYEGSSHTTNVVKHSYQSYPMDAPYKRFMTRLLTDKSYFYQTRAEEPGMLQRAYTSEGIETAQIYKLARTKEAVYFCSFSSKLKSGDFLNAPGYVVMEQLANKLRQLHNTAKRANLFD